jgi:hypothetical protein
MKKRAHGQRAVSCDEAVPHTLDNLLTLNDRPVYPIYDKIHKAERILYGKRENYNQKNISQHYLENEISEKLKLINEHKTDSKTKDFIMKIVKKLEKELTLLKS